MNIGFWIFMLIVDLLIPATMIGFGKYFSSHAPKSINMTFGYRTTRSMKNKQTWEFAHHHFGRSWFKWGLALPLPTVFALLFFFGKDVNTVAMAGLAVCLVQMVVMVIPMFFTEAALRKNFDEYGRKR